MIIIFLLLSPEKSINSEIQANSPALIKRLLLKKYAYIVTKKEKKIKIPDNFDKSAIYFFSLLKNIDK